MEALLQHLKAYGMSDVSFLIVNSKMSLSRGMIHKLEERVSFPVYQETDEEEVWSVLEGGKDDMFVYDKCGRLTYFIPFPLSVIHEDQPIVQAAVLSTYFQSPCGVACTENSTFVIKALDEEMPTEAIEPANTTSEVVHVEEDFTVFENTTLLYDEQATNLDNYTDPDYYDAFANFTNEANDTAIAVTALPAEQENTTKNHLEEKQSLLTALLTLFLGAPETNSASEDSHQHHVITAGEDGSQKEESPSWQTYHSHEEHSHAGANQEGTTDKPATETNEVPGRCTLPDENECETWGRRRLLQAQRCCSSPPAAADDSNSQADVNIDMSCKNFGKKRCAKMQPVLKCCLKTQLTLTEHQEVTEEAVGQKQEI